MCEVEFGLITIKQAVGGDHKLSFVQLALRLIEGTRSGPFWP
jgi:hypothetical protein